MSDTKPEHVSRVRRKGGDIQVDDPADYSLTLEEYHRTRDADTTHVQKVEPRPKKY